MLTLSFLSLAGVWLTVLALGGLGEWTRWQFVGFFGIVEAAAGLGNIIAPNIWRMPVAELQTKRSTKIHLAASAVLIPHWGGAARAVAGFAMMAVAAWNEGVSFTSVGLIPVLAMLAVAMVALSLIVARWGVDHTDLDVVQIVIRRAGKDQELVPISLGASVFQMLLSICTIPAIKLLPPDAFYLPEFAPSAEALAIIAIATALSVFAVFASWRGRIDWKAPRDQQREAEEYA